MRMLSQEELGMVAGGGIFDGIIAWLCEDQSSTDAPMQTVNITANRMSDVEKMAYDVQEIQRILPNCTVAFTISPTVVSGTANVTATSTSQGVTVGGTITRSSISKTVNCPAPIDTKGHQKQIN